MGSSSNNLSSIHKDEIHLLKLDKQNGKVGAILNGNFLQYLKDHVTNDLGQLVLGNSIEDFNKTLETKSDSEQLTTLMIGISSLYAFIQENWTGPRTAKSSDTPPCLDEINVDDKTAATMLCLDSIEFSTTPRQPKLLLLAKFVLSANYTKLISPPWWKLRMLHIHQSLLDENSSQILDQVESLSSSLTQGPGSPLSLHKDLRIEFYLELFHVYLTYGVISKIQSVIKEINGLADLTMTLKGALGKRTKWQQKTIAQLLLDITFNDPKSNPTPTDESPNASDSTNTSISLSTTEKTNVPEAEKPKVPEVALPHNIKLDDDTRLDTIQYEDAASIPSLSPTQQIVVYANLLYNYRTQPKDGLKLEELRPYIDVLLGQEGASLLWGVRYGALFLRSQLESDHRRTVERSMVQLEELRASLAKEAPPSGDRLEGFFMICAPSANTMESYLANVFVSLGDIKSALTIYETLRHWEPMILCYNLLQLRHLSEAVIREQMKAGETPKLYCLLGDATDEIEHYHTAWTLSGEKSARAMKSLGMYHYKRKEYKEAIPFFQRSLEINSIQIDLWSRLGYAAIQCEDQMDVACSAYNRYVSLEPDDFQGWNNLARAYLDRGQKLRAYNALVEAVRTSNMDNWKVIENLMRVALDVGQFECVVRSYSHLLDIKSKHFDGQVLSILVSAILEMLAQSETTNSAAPINNGSENSTNSTSGAESRPENQNESSEPSNTALIENTVVQTTATGQPSRPTIQTPVKSLLSNTLRLFGRLSSEILNESELWYLYAQLNLARDSASCAVELRKTLKYVTSAHACLIRDERSLRELEGRRRIAEVVDLWVRVLEQMRGLTPPLGDWRQVLVSAKLTMRSCLGAMEKQREGQEGRDEEVERVREAVERVQAMMSG